MAKVTHFNEYQHQQKNVNMEITPEESLPPVVEQFRKMEPGKREFMLSLLEKEFRNRFELLNN